MLVFHEDVVAARGDEIQKIVEVWFDVLKFIESNPDEAYAIMAKKVGQTPENYATFISGTKFFSLADNKAAYRVGVAPASLYGSGKIIGEFYLKVPALEITEVPDFKAAIEPKFIEAVQ